MAKKQEKTERPTFDEKDKAKARQWFAKGQELAEKKNYDYAIASYISGLEYWPEAVDEGHKPCRAAALFRGGASIGMKDKMKYKTSGKDHKKVMLNAEMLLSKETKNVGYMETMFNAAVKGRFDKSALWIGEILTEAAVREEKPNEARLKSIRQTFDQLAEVNADEDPLLAIAALEKAVQAQTRLRSLKPSDMEITNELRDLAGKLTILKGKYSSADSFRDSVHEGDSQKEIHDKERVIQSDERMDELIAAAKAKYQANPTEHAAIAGYADLLTRRENEAEEKMAMRVLLEAHEATKEFRYRMRAEDIRLRQLRRRLRVAEESDGADSPLAKEMRTKLLSAQLKVLKERMRQFPTDLRIKYDFGRLLFDTGNYDEAIPVLQEARADPKARHLASLYIGRCFFEKNYFVQAVDVFTEAIEGYEVPDDRLAKDLQYWLGRSLESGGKTDEAVKVYGQLIQLDYNFRDVRKRIDGLRPQG